MLQLNAFAFFLIYDWYVNTWIIPDNIHKNVFLLRSILLEWIHVGRRNNTWYSTAGSVFRCFLTPKDSLILILKQSKVLLCSFVKSHDGTKDISDINTDMTARQSGKTNVSNSISGPGHVMSPSLLTLTGCTRWCQTHIDPRHTKCWCITVCKSGWLWFPPHYLKLYKSTPCILKTLHIKC